MKVENHPSRAANWERGPIAELVQQSLDKRLRTFIVDGESEPICLFSEEMRMHGSSGDWYGEHAGKWLVTACLAAERTGDADFRSRIEGVVAYLISQQEPDGYLGTYSSGYEGRFTNEGADWVRTWDLWVHAWLILGFLAAGRLDVLGANEAATRIGDLLTTVFGSGERSVLNQGNHQGLSSTVILQPLAELTRLTGDAKYASLAELILQQMEAADLCLLSGPGSQRDIATIGTGKAYQLCWTLAGLAALAEVTQRPDYLAAAEYWWQNISDAHLTPMGGPWGGVATHKEVFNPAEFFSPEGFVETCSVSSWMDLSFELYQQTGNAKYCRAATTSLLNSLIGALDANGADWCYFTFPNGRRNNTYHWACCKSSGALALEQAARFNSVSGEGDLVLSLWATCGVGDWQAQISEDWQTLTLTYQGVPGPRAAKIVLPDGHSQVRVSVGDQRLDQPLSEGAVTISREWKAGDVATIALDFALKIHPSTFVVDHHGQEVVRTDYAYLSWGPFIYATGPIDGYKKEETIRLARLTPEAPFHLTQRTTSLGVPAIDLIQPGRPPIEFVPYFEAGGRHDGAWRATWIQVAWQ